MAYVYADLAEVLELAGQADEARGALSSALRLFDAKGDVVSARRVRERLGEQTLPRARA
jgi:hypothetical protein